MYIYLPPSTQEAKTSAGFSYNLLAGGGPPADFNLEVASWLFDLSWDVYYDAPGTRTASSTCLALLLRVWPCRSCGCGPHFVSFVSMWLWVTPREKEKKQVTDCCHGECQPMGLWWTPFSVMWRRTHIVGSCAGDRALCWPSAVPTAPRTFARI